MCIQISIICNSCGISLQHTKFRFIERLETISTDFLSTLNRSTNTTTDVNEYLLTKYVA